MTQDPMTHSDTCCPPTPPDAEPKHKWIYLSLEARTTVVQGPNAAQNNISWNVAVASLAGILQHHLNAIRSTNDSRYVHAEGVIGDAEQPGSILFAVDLSQLHDPGENAPGENEGGED